MSDLYRVAYAVVCGDERRSWDEVFATFVINAQNQKFAETKAHNSLPNVIAYSNEHNDRAMIEDDEIKVYVTPIEEWLQREKDRGEVMMTFTGDDEEEEQIDGPQG